MVTVLVAQNRGELRPYRSGARNCLCLHHQNTSGVITDMKGLPFVVDCTADWSFAKYLPYSESARLVGALEDRQQQTSSRPAIPKHIPDRERDELVLPQARAEGHRVQHMIAIARSVLAGDLEQGSLLAFGQGPWGACRVGVVRYRLG